MNFLKPRCDSCTTASIVRTANWMHTRNAMRSRENSFDVPADPATRRGTSEIEAVAEDHFGDQVIGGTCQTNSKAEIDFPFGRKIQIDCREYLVLLLADGIKTGDGTECAVILNATGDFLSEIVAEFEV